MANNVRLLANSFNNSLRPGASSGIQLKGKLSGKVLPEPMDKGISKNEAQFLLRRLYDERMRALAAILGSQRGTIIKLQR